MKDLFVNEFNGKKVYTFMWNDRPCWIATQVVALLDYEKPSKTVSNCINSEKFEVGFEYELLAGNKLKEFKKLATKSVATFLKHAPKLVLFYEDGLYGFLQYTHMPIGIEFRKWLRREVLPELREKGTYSINNNNKECYDTSNNFEEDNIDSHIDNICYKKNKLSISYDKQEDKIKSLKAATDSANVFKDILDDLTTDSKYKLSFLKALFSEAGIILPLYVDDEDII